MENLKECIEPLFFGFEQFKRKSKFTNQLNQIKELFDTKQTYLDKYLNNEDLVALHSSNVFGGKSSDIDEEERAQIILDAYYGDIHPNLDELQGMINLIEVIKEKY